jgi:hypothetical protein
VFTAHLEGRIEERDVSEIELLGMISDGDDLAEVVGPDAMPAVTRLRGQAWSSYSNQTLSPHIVEQANEYGLYPSHFGKASPSPLASTSAIDQGSRPLGPRKADPICS